VKASVFVLAAAFRRHATRSAAVFGRALKEKKVNRKLIRPSLTDLKDQMASRGLQRKKPAPPEQTNAENFYYVKQMQAKTPMVVVLQDGEQIRGVIEWYDKSCIKVHRQSGPNLLVYKPSIKYLYKENEQGGSS
jgi:sRNA-binding regulator protein Hfq